MEPEILYVSHCHVEFAYCKSNNTAQFEVRVSRCCNAFHPAMRSDNSDKRFLVFLIHQLLIDQTRMVLGRGLTYHKTTLAS
jgi:hypothetical protein